MGVPGKPRESPIGTFLQVLRLAELDKLDLIRAHGLLGANFLVEVQGFGKVDVFYLPARNLT